MRFQLQKLGGPFRLRLVLGLLVQTVQTAQGVELHPNALELFLVLFQPVLELVPLLLAFLLGVVQPLLGVLGLLLAVLALLLLVGELFLGGLLFGLLEIEVVFVVLELLSLGGLHLFVLLELRLLVDGLLLQFLLEVIVHALKNTNDLGRLGLVVSMRVILLLQELVARFFEPLGKGFPVLPGEGEILGVEQLPQVLLHVHH